MEWKENNDLRMYLYIARTFSRCVSRTTWSMVSKRDDRSKITSMKKWWLKLSQVSTVGHLNPAPKACERNVWFLLICNCLAALVLFWYWKSISVIVKVVSGSKTFGLVMHLKYIYASAWSHWLFLTSTLVNSSQQWTLQKVYNYWDYLYKTDKLSWLILENMNLDHIL